MEVSDGMIKYIPIFENEQNVEFSSSAIPYVQIKNVMGSHKYMRIRILKNKFWNSKENSHRPKYVAFISSTTTEKEIESEEYESTEDLKARIEELENAIHWYKADGITDYLDNV